MTLGEKIKFYRNKLNLSQDQLANKCNFSRNTIYNYENNKRTPTISNWVTIAKNLNIPSSDLLDDGNNINSYSNKLELTAIDNNIKSILYVEKETLINYELEMNQLYKKYFMDLFNWKTLKMAPHNYLKFILSLCPLPETEHMTEKDFNELSVLFYRLLTLKFHERSSINETEKNTPSNSKIYEKSNFLNIN